MRIINIVDRLDRVNFGIWNAAISTAYELKRQFAVESEIWFPSSTNEADVEELNGALPRALPDLSNAALEEVSVLDFLDPATDIIVTHGCWQYPTQWGRELKKRGFKWMAVPHGMLEPWSVSQKRIKKWIYFNMIEKRALRMADKIRAVGRPEFANLKKHFERQLVWIPNGVPSLEKIENSEKPAARIIFLFMARLHHKKGVLPLVRGWMESKLAQSSGHVLKIAGPDDGELDALKAFLNNSGNSSNIQILGPVYGEKKEQILKDAHFYILPSHSEGFPTSVLEAMQHGLIPIISEGCNFPDVFENDLGLRVEPDANSVRQILEKAICLTGEKRKRRSNSCIQYIQEHYTHDLLAKTLHQAFQQMNIGGN